MLCLPLDAASWCVVDGLGADGSPGLLPYSLQSVDLPFDIAESFVTSSPLQKALAVVGVPRSLVKAVAEQQGRIAFTLEAKLDPATKPTPDYLRGLGAEGLARRLELLQAEGVLP